MSLSSRRGLLLGACLLLGGLAQAQSTEAPDGPSEGGHPHGPPQAMLDACNGQSEGASCSFTFNGQTKDGTCHLGPRGDAAACFPADWHPHGPPPEAVNACAKLAVGTECSFAHGDHTVSGTCRAEHRDPSVNVCAPKDFDHPHHRPPPEAFTACASSQEGASCTVTFGQQTVAGTCRSGPRGDALACVPPHPER